MLTTLSLTQALTSIKIAMECLVLKEDKFEENCAWRVLLTVIPYLIAAFLAMNENQRSIFRISSEHFKLSHFYSAYCSSW